MTARPPADEAADAVPIDVIVPVHNAPAQTLRAIESVLAHSRPPYRLILVNDRSDAFTTACLERVAAEHEHVVLLHNEANRGFLDCANTGLRYGLEANGDRAKVKILLNSDTVVAPGWLEAFERCFAADEKIALATPLSNNAANLTVAIPEGHSAYSFAELLRDHSPAGFYPDVTTAIGYCMGIRTSVLESLGVFDEIFAPGYAEDSDYHFKAVCAGYRSVLVADCFVYHEGDASFADQKPGLIKRHRPIFDERWEMIYTNELADHNRRRPLAPAERIARRARDGERVHDVLFVLPTSKLFGGIIVVYEVVNRLVQAGVDANVVILSEPAKVDMDLLFTPYFRPADGWIEEPPPVAQIYVATHYETCPFVFAAQDAHPDSHLVYLIQGYEGWFPEARLQEVEATYHAIPNRVAVSSWLAGMLRRLGCDCETIGNGVDSTFFYPRRPLGDGVPERPLLATFLRDDPQKGWKLAFNLLPKLKREISGLRIAAIGPLAEDPRVAELADERHPYLDRRGMRDLLGRCDLFLDTSVIQGFGLPGLEAMASGAVPVLTDTGGVREYANAENAVLCPVGDEAAIVRELGTLMRDGERFTRLRRRGRETAEARDWRHVAERYRAYFERLLEEPGTARAPDPKAMNRYYLGRMLDRQRRRRLLVEVGELFRAELERAAREGVAAPATDLLLAAPERQPLQAVLRLTGEGQALWRLYEQARAQGPSEAAGRRLVERVQELLPPLA